MIIFFFPISSPYPQIQYYQQLWELSSGKASGTLGGRAAFEFLSKSGCPKDVLKREED
jgi:hypothetical protein